MSKRLFIVLFSSFSILLLSCQDEYTICNQSKIIELKAKFYTNTAGTISAVNAPKLTLSTLDGVVIYNQQSNMPGFSTMLNPLIDSVRYAIKIADNFQSDTITVRYNSSSQYLSPECGNIFIHNINSISLTHNTLDSIKISTNSVTNTGVENLRIFF
jgi:hypothetical protein